jgi:hypothetical protein
MVASKAYRLELHYQLLFLLCIFQGSEPVVSFVAQLFSCDELHPSVFACNILHTGLFFFDSSPERQTLCIPYIFPIARTSSSDADRNHLEANL